MSSQAPGDSDQVRRFKRRALARGETLFKRFKDFGLLEQEFCYGIGLHKTALYAVAVIIQYKMENGHPLFEA